MLPNLIVLGAAKSATTSLHHYLGQHPQIYMSSQKELQFFNRSDWRDHVDWYVSQFEERRIRGESSPAYALHPVFPGVPERMHALIPEARLLYLVRDPIERLLADYVEWYALRLEDRGLDEALRDYADPANPYVCASRYATQLEQYLNWFPPSRVKVIDREDLMRRRAATLAGVFSFLGVDPGYSSPEFERTLNPRERKWRLNRLGLWLFTHGARGPVVKRLETARPGRRNHAMRLLARPVETPRLHPALREGLLEIFHDEAERLRAHTGQRFASWPV